MANALIQKLLDAEKEAEVIIRRAKESKLLMPLLIYAGPRL